MAALTTVALVLLMAGCGGTPQQTAEEHLQESRVEDSSDRGRRNELARLRDEESQEAVATVESGLTSTFIGERFYEGKVVDASGALDAMQAAIERVGGDETTSLEFVATCPARTGMTYYAFRQCVGNVPVFGSGAKLMVDEDGQVAGLASSLLPQAPLTVPEAWACSKEQAESAVREACARQGEREILLLQDYDERVLVSFDDDDEERYHFAWAIYTMDVSDGVDMAYVAHFVSEDGTYLGGVRVADTGGINIETDEAPLFDFGAYERSTWTGEVTFSDGHAEEITVPVLVEPASGDITLGDAQRKILCADYMEWMYRDALTWRVAEDGRFDNDELIAYYNFIQVWDLYDELGWRGPDGGGTPSLLLMGLQDANGTALGDVCYQGFDLGFQTFALNVTAKAGECVDLIAHAFTHCLTWTSMGGNLFLNEYGSVDEGMCDVLGNLVEALVRDDWNGAWLMGESGGDRITTRSLSDPHRGRRPASMGDEYYAAQVREETAAYDCDGVYTNSSLLGVVSVQLDEAGMDAWSQAQVWVRAALAMTPRTDYAQMAKILPWCMEQTESSRYQEALTDALEQTRMGEPVSQVVSFGGSGTIGFTYPKAALTDVSAVRVSFVNVAGGEPVRTWPDEESLLVSASLPVGDYRVVVECYEGDTITRSLVYTASGWLEVTGDEAYSTAAAGICHVVDGATLPLSTNGLVPQVAEGKDAS